MKNNIISALLVLVIISLSCNNAADNTAAPSDSAASKDTIKSDPSTFSDPH